MRWWCAAPGFTTRKMAAFAACATTATAPSTDVTAKAGLLYYYPTHTAAWADFNNDGLLDLFVGHEIDRAHVEWPPTTKNFELYLNNGNGTFREVGAQSGIRLEGFVKGAVVADYDNDGRQDLYVTKMGGGNHLFRNTGNDASEIPSSSRVTQEAGVSEPNPELHDLVLRLQQRRLARYFRVRLFRGPAGHRARVSRPKG